MINVVKRSDCCGCGGCRQICPKGCITLQADAEGFFYPEVDAGACVECGLCERVCPILHSEEAAVRSPLDVYAAYAEDDRIREESSSGGIFSLAAQWILEQGGVVYGAAFAEDFSVQHVKIEHADELYRLRGSKYVQSSTENTYKEAKAALEQGRPVLYSGVGCQIAGLKHFLGKDFDGLYTVDVLCHGVPSPKAWQMYLDTQKKVRFSGIKSISFRSKQNGWHDFASNIGYSDGEVYCKHHNEDPFMSWFLSNISLRPSCHSCKFRAGRSGADITLGDAWGIESWMPEMDDDRGTSVVFVNSPKGQTLWEAVQPRVNTRLADTETVIRHNMVYRKSVKLHPNRAKFFKALENGAEVDELVRLTKKPLWRRVGSFGKRCIRKILGM